MSPDPCVPLRAAQTTRLLPTLLAPAAGHRRWPFCHRWHWQREKHPTPFSPLSKTLQVHISGTCLEETHQKEQPAPLLVLQGNIFGGRYPQAQMAALALQAELSSQLTPSRSGPSNPMPLAEPGSSSCHTPTQAQRRTGHCPLGQSSAQLEGHSSAEPNNQHNPWTAVT